MRNLHNSSFLPDYKDCKSEHPFVSVIVPVYNTKRYLKRCLDSVCSQTEPNIEIIVIDDASPDDSWQLIQEYSQRDSRIVAIRHKKNKHLGGARNTGIDAAKGHWILFLDSDDYIDCDTVRIIWDYSKKYPDVELLHYMWFFVNSESQIISQTDPRIKDVMIIADMFWHYCNMQYPIVWHLACGNIWKRDFLVRNGFRFPEHTTIEDFAVFMQWIYWLDSPALFIPQHLYYYRKHSGSITANFNRQTENLIKVVQILSKWLETLDEKSRNQAFKRVYHEIKGWVYHCLDQEHGNIFLQNIPACYAVKLFRQAQEDSLTNRWYRFRALSRKQKIWIIAKALSKKLFLYKMFRPFAKVVKSAL